MYLGGVVGLNNGLVSGSKSMSTINANTGGESNLNAGGVVGYNSDTITSSFSLGDITLSASKAQDGSTSLCAGGVVGTNIGTVQDCYNTGKVSASYPVDEYKRAYAGGIIGNLDTIKSVVTCAYNTGAITASGMAGSILGHRENGTLRYCYYLAGTAGSAYGTSLTATQMQTQSSYTGFDFLNTWEMNSVSKLPTLQSNPPIYLSAISFDQSSINIAKSGLKTLNVNFLPSNAEKKLTYKSANTAIATVSTTGTVTGVSLGSTTITVTDGYTGKSAVCVVNVRQGIDTLKVNGAGTVDVGLTAQLTTAITPTAPYDLTIVWRSTDETVATVSESGLVTGIKAGTATIYASAKLGTPATQNVAHQIQVIQHPESIKLDYDNLTLAVGENQTLTPTILPADTTDKKLTWYSSNESVATVSPGGFVTAVSRGDATITAKTVDGGLEATCAVNSIQKVESVLIDYDGLPVAEYTLQNGNSIQLSDDVQPDNANNQAVTCRSRMGAHPLILWKHRRGGSQNSRAKN